VCSLVDSTVAAPAPASTCSRVIAPLFRDLVRLYRATGRAVPRELQAACITLTLVAQVLDPTGSGGKVLELLDSTLALMGVRRARGCAWVELAGSIHWAAWA